MDIDELLTLKLQRAARAILDADGLLITAGAGMGVDSGLPDFRGKKGFWSAYPALGKLNIDFQHIARPETFLVHPALAWGFYGHRLNLYRKVVPHDGFHILREIAEKLPHGAFVATSNVDGHFQKSGFSEQRVYEVHGSIHRLQCMDQNCDTWSAQAFIPRVDENQCQLISEPPYCPMCGGIARPNILMFNDWGWNERRSERQLKRMNTWLAAVEKLVVIEVGAGKNIPTIREFGERQNGMLIRINPTDYSIPYNRGISLKMGGLDALQLIDVMVSIT